MPSYLDLAVLIVVMVSGLLALLRGFTREVLAIVSWVAAAAAAYYLYPLAMPFMKEHIQKESIAQAAAASAVFFVALILISLITVKLSDVILDSKIGALDRTLGFLFGAARGALLAVVAYMFYGWLVPDANQPEWVKTARTRYFLAGGAEHIRELLPQDVDLDSIASKIKKPKDAAPPADESGALENAGGGEERAAAPARPVDGAATSATPVAVPDSSELRTEDKPAEAAPAPAPKAKRKR